MTFEITVDDVPDSPPFFEGSFNQVINEDVPSVSQQLIHAASLLTCWLPVYLMLCTSVICRVHLL